MRLALALLGPAAVLAAQPASAACLLWGVIEGNGKPTTERREVPEFDGVRLSTPLEVRVRVGPPRSVTVELDGNLQELVTTRVVGGVLVVGAERSFRTGGPARVEVTVPALRRVVVEGSGDVAVEGGTGPVDLRVDGSGDVRWSGEATTMDAAVEGSGDVHLAGRAALLRVRVLGSGGVDASALAAVDVEASLRGSGDVRLTLAGGKLTAALEGSGDIRWGGATAAESVVVRGSGEASRL